MIFHTWTLPKETAENINNLAVKTGEHEFARTKERHQEKLSKLLNRKNEDNAPDLSGSQLKRWVVNLSKYTINKHEESLLAKGLNFAVTPHRTPTEDIIIATEQACSKLNISESQALRNDVIGLLKGKRCPPSNITKEEYKALTGFRKNKDLLIINADKGRATVILDKSQYVEQMNSLLGDEKTYEILKSNPTCSYKRKPVAILQRLKREEKITQGQYNYLYPTSENAPRMYGTPKIHEAGYPIRPIVDYTGSIAYNL
jgi:hypothetical protein